MHFHCNLRRLWNKVIVSNYLSINNLSHLRQKKFSPFLPHTFSQHFTTWKNDDGSREFRIPVSWGHVAGKDWGPVRGNPVIAMHGWLDNAATFDTLVPLLSSDLRIFALELPGHGFSSPHPKGFAYSLWQYLMVIHHTLKVLDIKSAVFIGHSLGAVLSYLYASTYPETVQKFVCLENFMVVPYPNVSERNQEYIKNFFKYEEAPSSAAPTYEFDEAVNLLIAATNNSLTEESARILLSRGAKVTSNGKFIFTRDLRLRDGFLDPATNLQSIRNYGVNIKSDILVVNGDKGEMYVPKDDYLQNIEFMKQFVNVEFTEISGTHHVHINDPQIVAPLINRFLEK